MMEDIQYWVKVSAYLGGGIAMGFGAIGAAIGEGYTAAQANVAISRNPEISGDIFKTMLVGQAVAESASIFALVVAMLLLFTDFGQPSVVTVWLPVSAGLCMGLGAIGAGIGSGFPAGAACTGKSRQPAVSNQLTTNMLIGAAVCQAPSIFALVTSFILLFTNFAGRSTSPTWAAMLGAGLCMGLGACGSGLGGGLIAAASCEAGARTPPAATPAINVMLLGQAVTQTTAVYSLLISFILMFKTFPPAETIAPAAALLGAGLCMGFGAIGPAIGAGFAGETAVKWIARNQAAAGDLTRVMLMGQAVAGSTGIYALVIALILIFVII